MAVVSLELMINNELRLRVGGVLPRSESLVEGAGHQEPCLKEDERVTLKEMCLGEGGIQERVSGSSSDVFEGELVCHPRTVF